MAQLEVGAMVAGYRIERVLGVGGMGVVYLATQISLGRPVALKLISPEWAEDRNFRERFVRESRTAASIDHPNVIPIYEAAEYDGLLYMAMRYVEGRDLKTLLVASGGHLAPQRAARIVGQVAAALDAAHAAGLVHRDVKPANILTTGPADSEHAYLADFGLTKRSESQTGLTGSGQFVGTIDYMAPEQIRGDQVGAGADVYALGCVCFETLTGRPPFVGDNDVAVIVAHLNEPPPRASELARGVPIALDDVLTRAMAKAPSDRYGSAGEFAAGALSALGQGDGPGVVPGQQRPTAPESPPRLPPPPPVPPRSLGTNPPPAVAPGRPRRWLVVSGAIGVALFILLVLAIATGSSDHQKGTPATTSGSQGAATTSQSATSSPSTTTASHAATKSAFVDSLNPSEGTPPDKHGVATAAGQQFRHALVYRSAYQDSSGPLTTSWSLGGAYRRFTAVLAVDDCDVGCSDSGSLFEASVDGRTVSSEKIAVGQALPVSVSVAGGQVLKLSMSFVKNFPGDVSWYWGDAKVSP